MPEPDVLVISAAATEFYWIGTRTGAAAFSLSNSEGEASVVGESFIALKPGFYPVRIGFDWTSDEADSIVMHRIVNPGRPVSVEHSDEKAIIDDSPVLIWSDAELHLRVECDAAGMSLTAFSDYDLVGSSDYYFAGPSQNSTACHRVTGEREGALYFYLDKDGARRKFGFQARKVGTLVGSERKWFLQTRQEKCLLEFVDQKVEPQLCVPATSDRFLSERSRSSIALPKMYQIVEAYLMDLPEGPARLELLHATKRALARAEVSDSRP
ncbi:MAG: hypothetical protein K8T20_01910 [Planctomycetes bacterium]|nr:hypothetical protein [Planctomycetota bacterium]